MPKREAPKHSTRLRCAIYTRKSSEEGLEQDFNSLDAQREACEAYIKSQIHAGWRALEDEYDDGGISGATMSRPALQRLLLDVKARKIDIVVVYKVDRLTRSLADFAKIVEIFDGQDISFVSVTQSFNTTTSMGRLTLNVLLSFAQFEREVTGERIRDKIAASKKKGLWMGGYPPLGYDVLERKLILNAAEAETVREIFHRYQRIANIRELKSDLDRSGIVTKSRIDRNGRPTGGKSFSRGALAQMLQNRIYLGEIVHKGAGYPGEHAAIINSDLWDAVAKSLKANRSNRESSVGVKEPSLLKGLLFDSDGSRMIPSHAVKSGKRYRYYVSQTLIDGKRASSRSGRRIPAGDIERLVSDRLKEFFASRVEVHEMLLPFKLEAVDQQQVLARASALTRHWPTQAPSARCQTLRSVIRHVVVEPSQIKIELDRSRTLGALQPEHPLPAGCLDADSAAASFALTIKAVTKRAGKATRLIVGDAVAEKTDANLIKLLVKAFDIRDQLFSSQPGSIDSLARETRASGSYMTCLVRLTYLAPDIIEAILKGRHPVTLSARRLVTTTKDLPMDWAAQRKWLDFPAV